MLYLYYIMQVTNSYCFLFHIPVASSGRWGSDRPLPLTTTKSTQPLQQVVGLQEGSVFWTYHTIRRLLGRLQTHPRDYVSQLAWKCLCALPEELEEVAGE